MAATAGLSLTLDPMGKMVPKRFFSEVQSVQYFREEYISVFSPYGPVLIL
jgi:hypothetical protein